MKEFSIEELAEGPGEDIIDVLAAAYLNVPLHRAVFPGDEKIRRKGVRSLFHMAIAGALKGTWLGARKDGALFGVLHYSFSPACSSDPEAQEDFGSMLMKNLGEAGGRIAEWFGSWAEVHPATEHWHLGPFAVIPEYQGQGIGSLLMDHYCSRMDVALVAGYLETDVPEIVPYYEKYGFRVIRETQVLGIPNWFMERNAAS